MIKGGQFGTREFAQVRKSIQIGVYSLYHCIIQLGVLESHVVECSMESFMHKDYKYLFYLHLFTDCFIKISHQSSEQIYSS